MGKTFYKFVVTNLFKCSIMSRVTRILFVVMALFVWNGYGQQRVYPKLIDLGKSKFGIEEAEHVLKTVYHAGDEVDFVQIKDFTDNLGYRHLKYQVYYRGIPVEFAHIYVHTKNGRIVSLNGDYFNAEGVDVSPALSKEAAFQAALNHVGARKYLWENPAEARLMEYEKPEGQLVLLPDFRHRNSKAQAAPRLAYKFDIYAKEPLSRANVYVDARTGALLYKDNIIRSAVADGTADTRYSGRQNIKTDSYNNQYRLRDYSRGGGIEVYDMNEGTDYSRAVDFVDNDNNWTSDEYNNDAKDNAALDAHWGLEMTYDFWHDVHNRNSFDNDGAVIKAYVHYDRNYDNAYWNGRVLTFGDGSDTYFDALTALDVVGHEFGHAVCDYTADLTYSYESGALDEGLADIWGACVEHRAAPNKRTWLIGEDIERRDGHQALRDMSNPNAEGQPDTYGGTNWYTGSSDNGGVHINSGVLNFWFYLISEGGRGTNDNGDDYDVTAIGMDKGAQIVYRAESVYMTSSTDYADMRTYTIQAARDIYGQGSDEEQTVTNAWYAVGVGSPYGVLDYCASKGKSVSDEYIQRVQLNTIDKTSDGGNGYSDFTDISTDLTMGRSYTITITPKWTGTVYDEGYAVWIDYNHDGDFEDDGELVFSKAASKDSPVSGTFTVPSNLTEVSTRMRVSMKYNGIPGPCETFDYGEVEDYTVNLKAAPQDTIAPSAPKNLTASNVTQTTVDLTWNASTDNVGVTGYNVYKDGSLLGTVTDTAARVTGLTANTTYRFYVKAKDEAGNLSAASNEVSVTTLENNNCSSTVTSYPYHEGFENTIGQWTQSKDDDFDWTVRSGSTPSKDTGPSGAAEGSYYVYMESSSPNYSNKRAILISPCFDLSGKDYARVYFKYHMYGASTMGSLKLEVSADNGSTWTSVWSKSGNQGNQWYDAQVNLDDYKGKTIQLRFNGVTGTTWQGDMAVDAFYLKTEAPPACENVTLSITFDDYPEETSWEIKDSNGNTVFSGGPYSNEPDRSTKTIHMCLNPGCYTFTIKDSYGDGICCSYGNGSYRLVKDADNTVIASGGSFRSSESTNFCLNTNSIAVVGGTEHPGLTDLQICPNPVDRYMNVQLKDAKMTHYTIFNLTGQKVAEGDIKDQKIPVSQLKPGVYSIRFSSDKKVLESKFIKR